MGAATLMMTSIFPLLAISPLLAQDSNVEGRVTKLEKEMGAVQRKVFPNADSRFFEADIQPEQQQVKKDTSNSAVGDLLVRIDSLETQLATLTGQIERQGNEQRQLDARLDAVEKMLKDAKAAENTLAATPVNNITAAAPSNTNKTPSANTRASDTRRAAVSAIIKPDTGDKFDDDYSYGFRLWEAKFYPEAQSQLETTVKNHPKHPRLSYARNLLGRAMLDDNKPKTSLKIFYDNYKEDPRGARAPDSLLYLGIALTQTEQAKEACEAFAQVETAYPTEASGRLASLLKSSKTKAKCK
ncbi:hypothetical protein LPB140_05460 [Sphingorhabdus lutea]|uniref:Tetratricopeptide repeat protein n=2 Tax=Sphingorhabdus lutea TaxID=1913578 RepID=A0A1L3JEQ2_9SPHN|nr:hypothetical protein LPB140_05460 [Sphingorhabdus lutea]